MMTSILGMIRIVKVELDRNFPMVQQPLFIAKQEINFTKSLLSLADLPTMRN